MVSASALVRAMGFSTTTCSALPQPRYCLRRVQPVGRGHSQNISQRAILQVFFQRSKKRHPRKFCRQRPAQLAAHINQGG